LLADTIGWRWSFIGQGPPVLLAILLIAFTLPSNVTAVKKGEPSKLRRVDFVGAFLLAVTIVGFLGALSLGGQQVPWSHPLIWGLLVGSLVLGTVFLGWEIKCAFEPIFPPQLVVKRDVITAYAVCALQTSAQVAVRNTPQRFWIAKADSG
jgi:MFS family permease